MVSDRADRTDRPAASAKDDARSVWGANPAGWVFGQGSEPGTREFFERVYATRSTWEQPWLTEAVSFASFRGRDVLEVGCGAGFDAYTILLNGGRYTGIDITPQNIERTRAHLGLFGLTGNVLEGDAEALPFSHEAFDVVYSNGVLHHTPDIEGAFREAYRVLRPGGDFYVIVYNRRSIYYALTVVLFKHLLRGGFRRHSLATRRSMIEYSSTGALPLVNVYSPAKVRDLLRRSGFTIVSTQVRKLVANDLPAQRALGSLWRRVPQRVLDRLGNRWGWYIVAHAARPKTSTTTR